MGILKLMFKRAQKLVGNPKRLPEGRYPAPDDIIETFDIEYKGRDGNTLTMDMYKPVLSSGACCW